MSAIDDRPPQLDERYARATRSTDLSASTEHRTDADILLAAGYAAQKNRNGMIALMAYRMKITGDRASKIEIVEALIDYMNFEVLRGKRTLHKISRPHARMVCQTVINWWSNDNCEECTGRLMEPIPGTPHLSAIYCKACAGGGKRPIPDVGARFEQHASWLAAELDHMLTFIVGDMARMLRPSLDLKIGDTK
jgi:hypothetical protein